LTLWVSTRPQTHLHMSFLQRHWSYETCQPSPECSSNLNAKRALALLWLIPFLYVTTTMTTHLIKRRIVTSCIGSSHVSHPNSPELENTYILEHQINSPQSLRSNGPDFLFVYRDFTFFEVGGPLTSLLPISNLLIYPWETSGLDLSLIRWLRSNRKLRFCEFLELLLLISQVVNSRQD
jgi:hypothetical protein